jgi:8-oxo-dGTP pyrophosphatase MutT (NUDIX family)
MRQAGRVLVIDGRHRLLLLHSRDPDRPAEPFWFSPGGGARPGETRAAAAARELLEETGIQVRPAELGEPVWHEVAEFSFRGAQYRQDQDFFLLRVNAPEVSLAGLEADEKEYTLGHHWWSSEELAATTETYYPPSLPDLLRDLAGRAR